MLPVSSCVALRLSARSWENRRGSSLVLSFCLYHVTFFCYLCSKRVVFPAMVLLEVREVMGERLGGVEAFVEGEGYWQYGLCGRVGWLAGSDGNRGIAFHCMRQGIIQVCPYCGLEPSTCNTVLGRKKSAYMKRGRWMKIIETRGRETKESSWPLSRDTSALCRSASSFPGTPEVA